MDAARTAVLSACPGAKVKTERVDNYPVTVRVMTGDRRVLWRGKHPLHAVQAGRCSCAAYLHLLLSATPSLVCTRQPEEAVQQVRTGPQAIHASYCRSGDALLRRRARRRASARGGEAAEWRLLRDLVRRTHRASSKCWQRASDAGERRV